MKINWGKKYHESFDGKAVWDEDGEQGHLSRKRDQVAWAPGQAEPPRSVWASVADGWRVVDDYYGQAVGKLQAESMMSTAASLFPQ
jgi:hypothetical protein